jgi:hypothetical protein
MTESNAVRSPVDAPIGAIRAFDVAAALAVREGGG